MVAMLAHQVAKVALPPFPKRGGIAEAPGLAFVATLVSLRLSADLVRRYRERRSSDLLVWAGALAAFAVGASLTELIVRLTVAIAESVVPSFTL